LDSQSLAFLWLALQSDCTLLICGNTGSGKTSTLNALFCFVPANERIVVVEETPEIRLPHEHQIRLASSLELGIDMHSLIVDSLRMRPDRIIVGEMRTASETKAFVDTLLAGQGKGSYFRIASCC
jgi:Flp pilus assembly CpaF family ATPase